MHNKSQKQLFILFQNFEGVATCKKTDTLGAIMDKIVKAEVHRLVVADDENRVVGIVSLSDILQYIILRPCGKYISLHS